MRIYKDFLTGFELCTDANKMKMVDDFFYEVTGKMGYWDAQDSDIDIGANASEEGGDDTYEASKGTYGIDIVVKQSLEKQTFTTKKEFKEHMKNYMKHAKPVLVENLGEDGFKTFQTKMNEFCVTKILKQFSEWDMYYGPTDDTDQALLMFVNFLEDGSPYAILLKDCIIEEKV